MSPVLILRDNCTYNDSTVCDRQTQTFKNGVTLSYPSQWKQFIILYNAWSAFMLFWWPEWYLSRTGLLRLGSQIHLPVLHNVSFFSPYTFYSLRFLKIRVTVVYNVPHSHLTDWSSLQCLMCFSIVLSINYSFLSGGLITVAILSWGGQEETHQHVTNIFWP